MVYCMSKSAEQAQMTECYLHVAKEHTFRLMRTKFFLFPALNTPDGSFLACREARPPDL